MSISRITANYINNSKACQKLLTNISDNPSLYANRFSCGVNGILRPLTTIAVTPNKWDGVYGASSSVSSSVVELITGNAILKPMKKAIENSSKNLQKVGGIFETSEAISKYKSVTNRMVKISMVPLNTVMKYTVIAPIAKLIKKGLDLIHKPNNGINIHG